MGRTLEDRMAEIEIPRFNAEVFTALRRETKKMDGLIEKHWLDLKQAAEIYSEWRKFIRKLRKTLYYSNLELHKVRQVNTRLIKGLKRREGIKGILLFNASIIKTAYGIQFDLFQLQIKKRTIGKSILRFSGSAASAHCRRGQAEVRRTIEDLKTKIASLTQERNKLSEEKQFLCNKLLSRDSEGRNDRADKRRKQELRNLEQQYETIETELQQCKNREREMKETIEEAEKNEAAKAKKYDKVKTKSEKMIFQHSSKEELNRRLTAEVDRYTHVLENVKAEHRRCIDASRDENEAMEFLCAQLASQQSRLEELAGHSKTTGENGNSSLNGYFDSCEPARSQIQLIISDFEEQLCANMKNCEASANDSIVTYDALLFQRTPSRLIRLVDIAYSQLNHVVEDDDEQNYQIFLSLYRQLEMYRNQLDVELIPMTTEVEEYQDELECYRRKCEDLDYQSNKVNDHNKRLRSYLNFIENGVENEKSQKAYLEALDLAESIFDCLERKTD